MIPLLLLLLRWLSPGIHPAFTTLGSEYVCLFWTPGAEELSLAEGTAGFDG